MGCAPSEPFHKKTGLRLLSTKLAFTRDQLNNLNAYFRKLIEDASDENDSTVTAIEASVEGLVQRLMLAAGNLDRRFSSMFLVSLNEPRRTKQMKFEYLLRVDELSTPVVCNEAETIVNVEEDSALPGFIRLKILAAGVDSWHEYVDVGGRLRRDLVKAKLANLLATTIKREVTDCASDKTPISPGQVVDADVLEKILNQPEHCRIFYGPAVSGPLPEPRTHRVALIEDSGGILLRIDLEGCKARDIEVRLLIGIGVSSWSNLADYPRRIPLHHCDALLHYTAAQSGMYAVAVGPYTGARCEDRATLWRVRVPAAEKIMNQHYADDSVPALTESVLMEILYQLRDGQPFMSKEGRTTASSWGQDRLRVVSRHILRTVHRWSLERAGPDPLTSWAPDTLSRHVLLALDELVTALKCQSLRCYFHPRCNVMLQCAKGGLVHHEDSYLSDSRFFESYLTMLHHRSLSMTPGVPRQLDVMEGELIVKWRSVMASLPRGTMNADYGYSQRQLEYLGLILEEVLKARDAALQDHSDDCSYLNFPDSFHTTRHVENLVYLLKLIMLQARDQMHAMGRKMRTQEHRKILRKRRGYNTTSHFDYSVGMLIDVVRRDRETANTDLEVPVIMTKTLLGWLHFAVEYDKKILEPILRPYLGNLFNTLHENSWYSDIWKKRRETYSSEMQSLSTFCKLVAVQKISPASALVDFLSKGWCWAECMINMIERSNNSLRLIFVTRHEVLRYNLTFAGNKGLSKYSTWSKARNIGSLARRRRMSCRTSKVLDSLFESGTCRGAPSEGVAGHVELRDVSPLTYVATMDRSRVRQRGPADLISAMISLSKFRILQEAAAILPREERMAMLDMIHRLARETSRSKKANLDSSIANSPRQSYRLRPESDLLDSPPQLSPGVHQRRIIAEHQKQLQREMQEMHDSLRRNVIPRQRSLLWDSHSVSSWTSLDSAGTVALRKYRVPIWDSVGGTPMRERPADRGTEKNNRDEMISREESPDWSSMESRRKLDDVDSKDEDRLPSWDTLEATLNKKLHNYSNNPPLLEAEKGIGN